jgi:PTS system nitrogen regulatory IIA component
MSQEFLTLDQLAERLHRDRRELERLVQRGRIPGHRVEGAWRFHPTEVTQWLEQELRSYSDAELAVVEESNRSPDASADIPVTSLLRPETVQVPLDARTKRSVLESLIEVAGRSWQVWEPALLLEAVQQREVVMSTAFENGVAMPHPRSPLPAALGESVIAFGRTLSGIPFGASKRGLSDVFFLVLCRDARTHLHVLARLGRILQLPGFLDKLRATPDSESTYAVICAADRQVAGESA